MTRYEAFISGAPAEIGMSSVIVARFRGPAAIEIGVFLVDTWCLGIKDALFIGDATEAELRHLMVERMPDGGQRLHPACARKLIEGAAAFAERLGFAPHRDSRKARRVLGGLDARTCAETFTFGCNGRPRFVAGPDDSRERIERVLTVLQVRCGEEGFDFIDMVAEEDPAAGFARLPIDVQEELLTKTFEDACVHLREFLAGTAAPAPTYRELCGMLGGLCIGRASDKVDRVIGELVDRAAIPLEDAEERRKFCEAAGVVLFYQISLFVKASEAQPDQARPIHLWDAAKGDRADLRACLAAWCRGFLRMPEIWPEVWRPVLARPDLAPHWKLMRAWADPAAQGAIDAAVAADAAGGSLSKSVMALHAAFRARA